MSADAGVNWGSGQGSSRPTEAPYIRRTTDDRDEAERVITDLYLPNWLDLSGGSAPLNMQVTGMRLGTLTVARLSYGRPVRLCTADAENFHLNLPMNGRAASRTGSGDPVLTSPGEGLVFSPGSPAQISWSKDCEQLCLMISRARLGGELERLLGRALTGPLIFDFGAALQAGVSRRLRPVLHLLLAELKKPTDVSQDPLMARHLEELVLDGLLLYQPHNYSVSATRIGRPEPRSAIKRAVELMEDRPSEPWTTLRLAAEVHLSPRALQAGFRRDLATPPMTYLREVRLRHAREALNSADPETTTVRAIANSVGMWHQSRFASAYLETFGEHPSDTLNRSS